MTERYFTPAEVEALIPSLDRIMEDLMKTHVAMAGVRERMQDDQQRIALSGGGVIDQDAWRADRGTIDTLAKRMQDGIDAITELGGVPKDLGLGLVDFAHLRGGREVNLCWKYGERNIRYWHGLDEGYAGRKPL